VGVREAEQHNQELKEPLVRSECRLLHVIRVHSDLVVPGVKVELGEVLGIVQIVQLLFKYGYQKLVLDVTVVYRLIIEVEPPRSVNLLDEEDRHRECR
jgi:hypothetical protein